MAFAVSVLTSNGGKFTTRFQTGELALADARDREEHGEEGVTITIAATGETFGVEDFALKMTEASPS